MKIFPQNLRSTSRFSPAQKARALGVPHKVPANLLTNPSYAYNTPYYHAFLIEKPGTLPTTQPVDFGRFVWRTVVRFSSRQG